MAYYSDDERLRVMLACCGEIQETIERFGNDVAIFLRDKDYYRSVTMSLWQICGLAGELTDEFKANTSKKMFWGMLHLLQDYVALYDHMDKQNIWGMATIETPALAAFCEEILAEGEST